MIEAISQGRCINFHSLYGNIVCGNTANPIHQLSLGTSANSNEPVVNVETCQSDRSKITNFESWSRTWFIFAQVLTLYYPNLYLQLNTYHQQIATFASTYPTANWLAYDAAFRQSQANNPGLSWARDDNTLFNQYLRSAPPLPSTSLLDRYGQPSPVTSGPTHHSSGGSHTIRCSACGVTGHSQQQCTAGRIPQHNRPFRASQRSIRRHMCWQWNEGRNCPSDPCRGEHRCSFCHGYHPRHVCNIAPGR